MIFDALVIGAGPAGCAAAARLAREGAKVALVHHPSTNRRPSETLPGAGARVLAAAGLGPVDGLTEGRCGGSLSAWGSEQLVASDTFGSPDGAGWWIDRARFDPVLRARCLALNVTLVTERVREVRRDGRGWFAHHTGDREVCARWLIDATGRAATFARRLGGSRRAGPPLVALHSRTRTGHDLVPARIFLEAQAHGWWYIGASSQHRIGAVAVVRPVDAHRLRNTEQFVARLRDSRHLARWAGTDLRWSSPRASPAGGVWLDRICGREWIACGDAAMAFDPLSSQGLLGALVGGVGAAHAICSDNTAAALTDITARHTEISRVYESRRSAAYAQVRRWSDQPFWSHQLGADHRRDAETAS